MFEYELFAVVTHEGKLDNGHYWADVRTGDEWWHCDDDKGECLQSACVGLRRGEGLMGMQSRRRRCQLSWRRKRTCCSTSSGRSHISMSSGNSRRCSRPDPDAHSCTLLVVKSLWTTSCMQCRAYPQLCMPSRSAQRPTHIACDRGFARLSVDTDSLGCEGDVMPHETTEAGYPHFACAPC